MRCVGNAKIQDKGFILDQLTGGDKVLKTIKMVGGEVEMGVKTNLMIGGKVRQLVDFGIENVYVEERKKLRENENVQYFSVH